MGRLVRKQAIARSVDGFYMSEGCFYYLLTTCLWAVSR
jgi:hypothetical protein